jgi:hypothetical protein
MAGNSSPNHIVVIGDLVASQRIAATERGELQERLKRAFEQKLRHSVEIESPFTITLGDEFQAVYAGASDVFPDALEILAAAYPHRVRFAFGLGTISTPINPASAIGMDGPAFYSARRAIDQLKKNGDLFRIGWLQPSAPTLLADESLSLLSHFVTRWNRTRLLVAAMRYQGAGDQKQSVASIAAALDISPKTVYKTIRAGVLSPVMSLLSTVASFMDRQIGGIPLEAP